jgi:asparagine synthase (glutamine-hydrolysing)
MSRDIRRQLADVLTAAADDLTDAPTRLSAWTDRQNLADVGADVAGWRELAQHWHGIELAAPFLDNEVIRACLAVPAEQRGAPDRYKPLLAEAFTGTGVVPEFVLERSTKGGFDAVAFHGLREHAPVLRELLGASSRLAELGLLTPQPVMEMMERAGTGRGTAMGALHLVVAAEVWLRQLDVSASSWWEVVSRVATA